MKPPRSTLVAERILVALCAALFIFFIGYEVGRHTEVRQAAPCIQRKLSVHTMDARKQKLWVRYLAKEKQ